MMAVSDNYYTLITGASIGIGRGLAIECARRNMNLVLVDLPDSPLTSTVKHLNKHYSVDIKYLYIDLTTPNAPQNIYNRCNELGIVVNILINNAGMGYQESFCHYDYSFYQKMIRLNIESVVLLSRLFIPDMKKLDQAYILNLGSIASFHPIPFKIVYAGSKSFVYSFSRALKEELKNTSVNVSVLCPGPIITNMDVIQRIRQGGCLARISTMRPVRMAEIAISRLLKGKAVIIPGFVNKCYLQLSKLMPLALKQKFLYKKFNVSEKI